ncbi:type II secretion system protein [Methylobacter sp. BlB1]|uniref:type II secretion system protein n=1 Tax=Methylobacter sp. BlB1 TaxID=2785914 RepID=UPI0018952D17|nr:prepilin-type N-terminal cleavage/methylation domain-containing protein [Methylobacter sp. BlB1]MBF6649740.1 prepilin-type N-terminal cleavage/methylation domain-containing protein [Methylobacter sp. BlB1]
MNINQMKEAIKKFRAADFSAVKDEELRAKAQKLQAKQGGFTLLELLVVITLLATLATAALVAYEGIGENAQDSAASSNLLAAESSVRNFRAVTGNYPNQWDNLANLAGETAGGAFGLLADRTRAFFGQWAIPNTADATVAPVWNAVAASLNAVGINELQTLQTTSTFLPGNVPNLAFNESNPQADANPADELEFDETGAALYGGVAATDIAFSIVPSDTGDGTASGGCSAGGIAINTTFGGTTLTSNRALNLINDHLDDDGCHLVLALGFGKDVPGTTLESTVAIAQAPTAGTANVNPAQNYARLIALFQVGEDGSDGTVADGNITAAEIFPKARLIGFVDPEGRIVDQTLAGANTGA